jgi:hypothetical protein
LESEKQSGERERKKRARNIAECESGLESEKESGERGLIAQGLYHGIKHSGQFICFET